MLFDTQLRLNESDPPKHKLVLLLEMSSYKFVVSESWMYSEGVEYTISQKY